MKKYIGTFNNNNLSTYNLKLKSILSIFIIGIFIFFGFASIDEGDPETKTLNDCDFLHPPVAIAQTCSFEVTNSRTHQPPIGLIITFFIREYEKADDNGLCHLVLKNSYTKTLNFGSTGKASFILSKSYISNEDEIEIYFKPSLAGYYEFSYTFRMYKYEPGFLSQFNLFPKDDNP